MTLLDQIRAHWADRGNYPAKWIKRAGVAAGLAGDAEWICDIGCGPRFELRPFLPQHVRYLPVDMYRWDERTELCDLTKGQPPSSAALADVCFLLGVLEYLPDIESVVRSLGGVCDRIVFSYCSTDLSSWRSHLWVNAYSEAELRSLIDRSGFAIDRCLPCEGGQHVMSAHVRTPASAERRAALRQRLPPQSDGSAGRI